MKKGPFFKFVYFMMVDFTKIKAGESSGMMGETRISNIVSGIITDQKLDGNNFLQ